MKCFLGSSSGLSLEMFKSTENCVQFCILATISVICSAQLVLRNNKELFYGNRRWFIKNNNFKYILHWTSKKLEPFQADGMESFIKGNCSFINCVVTSDKGRFNDLRYFDAIIFHGPDFWYTPTILDSLPRVRSLRQKYIYYSVESADNYPICDDEVDDFFNLTWTYRLSSDLPSPYLIVRDRNGAIVGPKAIMHWRKVDDMIPINANLKNKLKNKSRAVAWLVSICKTASKREIYAWQLKNALKTYLLDVDIFGKCGEIFKCGRKDLVLPDCWEMIEEDYYFYLSFENSFDEDYVTEKLLNPLLRYTVPIVYGAANYSRFMPDGAYINAKEKEAMKLAKEISDIINDEERYYSFFKWHNYYSYHSPTDAEDSNPLCALCKMLNEGGPRKRTYYNFRKWWNLPGVCPTEGAPAAPQEVIFI